MIVIGRNEMDIRILESMKECVQATLKRVGDQPNIYIPLTTRNLTDPSKVDISVGVRGRVVSYTVPKEETLRDEVKQLLLELDGLNVYEIRDSGKMFAVPYKDRILIAKLSKNKTTLTILHIKTLMDILAVRPSTSKIEEKDRRLEEFILDEIKPKWHGEFYVPKEGPKVELKLAPEKGIKYPGWHLRYGCKTPILPLKVMCDVKVGEPMTAVVIACASKSEPILIPFNRNAFNFITSCLGVDENDNVKYQEQFTMCLNRVKEGELKPITFKGENSILTDYQKNVEVQANETPDSLIMEVPVANKTNPAVDRLERLCAENLENKDTSYIQY